MEQQTAVEFLLSELDIVKLIEREKLTMAAEVVRQAKAMEKEQMHKCASFWRGKENEIEKPMFDLYYNETYKK